MSQTTVASPRKGVRSRERMVASTIELLRRQGVAATTIDAVIAHSGAPRGSMYYHFPKGREQLIDEAVARAGVLMTGVIEAATAQADPVAAIDEFFALWRDRVAGSDYASGCPIVAVAVEGGPESDGRIAHAGEVFASWQEAFTAMLTDHGIPEARSRRLASLIIAAEEGAVVLARAQRSSAPIDDIAEEIHEILRSALGHANRPTTSA